MTEDPLAKVPPHGSGHVGGGAAVACSGTFSFPRCVWTVICKLISPVLVGDNAALKEQLPAAASVDPEHASLERTTPAGGVIAWTVEAAPLLLTIVIVFGDET